LITKHRRRTADALAGVLLSVAVIPSGAQQVAGTPGSPNATTTVDGRYLPPQKFNGKIELNAAQSTPAWRVTVVPPKGAPNILLIMTEDVGFAAPSTFGGVILTPTLDRVAAMSALHQFSLHVAVLADACGAHYRPQSSLRRIRCGLRSCQQFPGLQQRDR